MLKRQTEVRKKKFWKKNDNFEGVWHPFGSDLGVWRFTYVICDLQTGNVQIFSRRYDHFLSKNFFIFESSDVSFAGVLSKILADGTSWWSPQPLLKIPAGGNIVVPPRPPALKSSPHGPEFRIPDPEFRKITFKNIRGGKILTFCGEI